MKENREGTHEHYTTTARHFCPDSEAYTGADSLLTAQREGWQIVGRMIYREDVLLRGSRFCTVYYFRLQRGSKYMTMPIICNPYIQRMIRQYHLQVMPHSRQQQSYDPDDTVIVPGLRRARA